jgi:hypothetical protein
MIIRENCANACICPSQHALVFSARLAKSKKQRSQMNKMGISEEGNPTKQE